MVEVAGKMDMRVNTVQRMCMHVSKCKNDTYENFYRNRGKEG
jgi:hypothetical protein